MIESRPREGDTPMLVGREAESARLEELLDAVDSGPVACVIEGSPGIGKTSLWRESVEIARRRGYQVLETAPSEPDAILAFSGLGDIFDRIPGDAFDDLPKVQAEALRAALFLGELPESSRDLEALPRAILRLLRQCPLLVPWSSGSTTSSGSILRRRACSFSHYPDCVTSASG